MNEEFNVSPADFEKLTPDEVQNNENISDLPYPLVKMFGYN